jgi:hypothetical protein
MKGYIKNKLKTILEGRLATHTPINSRGNNVGKVTTQSDYNRVLVRVVNAMTMFKNNPEGYGSVYYGDGVYQVDLFPNGELVGKQTSGGTNREPGTFNDPNYNKRSFFVKSCTNIQHKDQSDKTCSPVGASPMSDAVVKVLVFFKDDILEFLKKNMSGENPYTADNKGAEISKELTPDNKKYMYDKLAKEKERASNKKITASDELKSAVEKRQADALARREKALARRNK